MVCCAGDCPYVNAQFYTDILSTFWSICSDSAFVDVWKTKQPDFTIEPADSSLAAYKMKKIEGEAVSLIDPRLISEHSQKIGELPKDVCCLWLVDHSELANLLNSARNGAAVPLEFDLNNECHANFIAARTELAKAVRNFLWEKYRSQKTALEYSPEIHLLLHFLMRERPSRKMLQGVLELTRGKIPKCMLSSMLLMALESESEPLQVSHLSILADYVAPLTETLSLSLATHPIGVCLQTLSDCFWGGEIIRSDLQRQALARSCIDALHLLIARNLEKGVDVKKYFYKDVVLSILSNLHKLAFVDVDAVTMIIDHGIAFLNYTGSSNDTPIQDCLVEIVVQLDHNDYETATFILKHAFLPMLRAGGRTYLSGPYYLHHGNRRFLLLRYPEVLNVANESYDNRMPFRPKPANFSEWVRFCGGDPQAAFKFYAPRTLQACARHVVLDHLPLGIKRRTDAIATSLNLPLVLQNYLNFNEFDSITFHE